MSDNHTPAPWVIKQRTSHLGAPNGRYVILGTEHLKGQREDFFVCEMPFAATTGVSERESNANAVLIAAAPDLLAALKNSADWIDRLCVSCDIDPEHIRAGLSIEGETLASSLAQFRTAIAKATGGSGGR